MTSGGAAGLADDLAWWREHRYALGEAEPEALRGLRARLAAWKAQHDQDRAAQPGPFLKLAWDAVFSEDDEQVVEAMHQLETVLERG